LSVSNKEYDDDDDFGVKIFNVVLTTGRQTTVKIIKAKQQFYCLAFCNNG